MARHNEILNKFKDILADGFSFENEVHKSMVRHSIVPFLMSGKISTIFKKSYRTELKLSSRYTTCSQGIIICGALRNPRD